MRSCRCLGLATVAAFVLWSAGIARGGVDQWDFNGSLAASAGSGTLVVDAPGTIAYTTAVIDGADAQVASFAAGTILRLAHAFPANGGGAYVNQYTLVMDVMFPDTATVGYASLWQTGTANTNDGDWFVKSGAGVGISGTYAGSVADGVWHRLALVVDLAAGTLTSYVDGVRAMQLTLTEEDELVVDGRWSLDPEALIFADNDGETAAGFVNSIQFRDQALSAGAVATLGGPTAFGLPASVSVDFEQPDGPPVGWYVIHPNVTVESGVLALTPAGAGEATALAGLAGEPVWFDSLQVLEFDLAYPGNPADWPPDHGGVIFCCQNKADRWTNTGYLIDYLNGGFRCLDMPGGAQLAGNSGVTTYEGRWRIELTDTTIRFLVNGVEQFTVADSRWRGGSVGFWNYVNGDQKMTVDNLVAEFTPAACPTLLTTSVVGTVTGPKPSIGIRIPTLNNLPGPYDVIVTSADPSVAAPVGHTGGSLVVTIEQYGPQVKYVQVEAYKEGETELSVSVAGQTCSGTTAKVEVWNEVSYCEDFAQADGLPEDWAVVQGTVAVESEVLTFGPPSPGEVDVFAGQGGVPAKFLATTHIEFDMSFPGETTEWPYDHGGVIFCAQNSNGRYANPGSCYVVDYLPTGPGDPSGGRFRLSKFVNGAETGLISPAPTPGLAYEGRWAIDLTTTDIKFSFNGTEVFSFTDASFRDGYLGFWAYQAPANNKAAVDNVCIVSAAPPCPGISPASASNRPVNPKTVFTVNAPFGSTFDADYSVTVTSTQPEVAVPVGATDGVLVLNFAAGGALTQTFEAECLSVGTTEFVLTVVGATCPNAKASFTVPEPGLAEYCENFAQADGVPQDWTTYLGNWQVVGEKLAVTCVAGENPISQTWIWAGASPVKFEGAATYEFSVKLTQTTADGVGRHAGFMLFASAPTQRGLISGYDIDWIDRVDDHGYRMLRYDNGVPTTLVNGTPLVAQPGAVWKVEVDASNIRVFADGALVIDVVDASYREGYFGFWTYCNTTQATFDNLGIGLDCAAPAASFTATPETGVAPLEVAFDASGSTDNVGIVSYAWDFGDLTVPGTGVQATHTYAADGTYTVVLTVADAAGYVETAKKVLTIGDYEAPAASFTATPETGVVPLEVAFDASGSTDNVGIVSYAWDFGDLTVPGTGVQATHTFAAEGAYTVILTVADAKGNVATTQKVITVTAPLGVGPFKRGDANNDGKIDLSDGVSILNYLFLGGPTPECLAAADTSQQGELNLTSGIYVLNFLFLGGPEPPAPYPACGRSSVESDVTLGCVDTSQCP